MNIKIKRLSEHAVIPKYANPGDSGFDLVSVESISISPGETKTLNTGLAFEIPTGFELQIRPRSGITSKTKLRVNFGTVDSSYRGEVMVSIDNISNRNCERAVFDLNGKPLGYYGSEFGGTYFIEKGDRIAQGIISPVAKVSFEETEKLKETERGENGFGSTGVR